jgi:hypothetical protein
MFPPSPAKHIICADWPRGACFYEIFKDKRLTKNIRDGAYRLYLNTMIRSRLISSYGHPDPNRA